MAELGSALKVVNAPASSLGRVRGIGPRRSRALHRAIRRVDLRSEERWLERHEGRFVSFDHGDYPRLLAQCPDPPGALRLRGVLPPEGTPCIALVGTRRATAYGLRMAGRVSQGLLEAGCWLVSGGARGIDAEVHRTALRCGGRTLVILGNGLADPYPPEHAGLYDSVVDEGGGVLSETSIRQPPRPGLFPRRNRIISGLSLAVVVIEAPMRSGAMITARLAVEEHGRDAMAMPGHADALASAGCHHAIRSGWAHLVTSADDVLESLMLDYNAALMLKEVGRCSQ